MPDMSIEVTREQALAYRIQASGLARSGPVRLGLGIQDTPYGSAALALAARGLSGDGLTLVWGARGAPVLLPTPDLARHAAALWPVSDADATTRIMNPRIKEGARLGIAAFTAAASAMREVVTAPMGKGEVSTGVSALVPESLTYDCEPCQARHISGALFQQVGLAAGVRVVPAGRGTTLAPLEARPSVPEHAEGTGDLIKTFLRRLGPATPAEAAKFIGTSQTALRPVWPDDLAEVRIDGRRAWLPADAVDDLRAAKTPEFVRLLPYGDPYMQARDRTLLVPDPAREKAVWKVLAAPGAVLADGEIVGTWRAKLAKARTLEVTVTPFEPLTARTVEAIEAEARLVAAVRKTAEVRVLVAS
jgi:hypothetical protein